MHIIDEINLELNSIIASCDGLIGVEWLSSPRKKNMAEVDEAS